MKNQTFDYSVNVLQALLWRFNTAPNLQSLVVAKQAWYDANQTQFWTDWFTNVFNIPTANDFGCAVWAIILGIPLAVVQQPDPEKPTFGFGLFVTTGFYNFNNSNFGVTQQTIIPLTLEQKRLVLRLRYFQLISRGTVTQTNRFLKQLFADFGGAYVVDGLDMTCTYVFQFVLPSALQFVFSNYDLLPRPAGVSVTIVSAP